MASDDMNNEKDWYQVHTANEDGWTDYHEEDDETDDFEIAVDWLMRSDVVWGEIRYKGKVVAYTEEIEYDDEQDEYDARYNPRPKNRIIFEDGWDRRGKIASTKKSTATESMPSYHSGIGLGDVSDADMREKIDTMMAGLDYMDEPWKGRLSRICDDWKAGKISTYECYNEISDIEYRQSVSIKGTKKMKKSDDNIYWDYRMPVIDFIKDYKLPYEYYVKISGSGYPGTTVGSSKKPLPEEYYNCPVVEVAVVNFAGKFVEIMIDTSEMKKSAPSIHDMIAQTRANNNSLVKSRVDLHKNLSSVGASYPLDYDRISNEMLDLILQSRQPNGDYQLDVAHAYDEWEKKNYDIDIFDEYGDKVYEEKLWDEVEDKFINYKKRQKRELMDRVYDLEYNDLVEFRNRGEYYVKSTNGNGSYEGCMIWAGPDKNNDRGWYFYASDFVDVVRRSGSGDRIFI